MEKGELKYISEKEYLVLERLSAEKHEYFRGEIFAMSGASFAHNKIFQNAFIDIGTKLKGRKCQPFGSDMRVSVKKNTLYTYLDISVFCSEPETIDDKFDTATNPTIII